MEINFSCATLSNGILRSIRVPCILRLVCLPRKYKRRVRYSVVYHECISILYHATEKISGQDNQCDISVAHHGKVGCNTVEYSTAFSYSDWLYLPWHGINRGILTKSQRENLILNFLFFSVLFCFVFCYIFFKRLIPIRQIGSY